MIYLAPHVCQTVLGLEDKDITNIRDSCQHETETLMDETDKNTEANK